MKSYPAEKVDQEWRRANSQRAQRELSWKLELNHHRFEELWRKAQRAGEKAMAACAESPGWCCVRVRIPVSLFASWLVKTGKAKVSADFDGKQAAVRVCISFRGIHDCDRLEAYAKAFARVLIAAGIDAYDESELD
jgi:hypothetical protein